MLARELLVFCDVFVRSTVCTIPSRSPRHRIWTASAKRCNREPARPCRSPTRKISRTIICRSPSPASRPAPISISAAAIRSRAACRSGSTSGAGKDIVVEPQEALASLHRQVRPRDTVVSGLIGARSGSATLFVVDRLHALTTTSKPMPTTPRATAPTCNPSRSPAMTLAELCASHGVDVDRLPEDRRRRRGSRRHCRRRLAPLPAEGRGGRGDQAAVRKSRPGTHGKECCSHRDTSLRCSTRSTASMSPTSIPISWRDCPRSARRGIAVRHMYEIGRAGENAVHPDHQLALALVHGFLARLPHLAPELLASFLDRESKPPNDDLRALQRMLADEALRMRLGRIACGYDGGHIESASDESSALGTAPVFAQSD